ncbi:beta-ketoadipate enol-lactone hydrolase [Coprinopsis marcescibilis]|nr:beta-ketoadipate enol-lactone hydrolase [Coprinopsis marcescibilis]
MSQKSRLLPGLYPAPGEDHVADHIRKRRGERGITPLDANLLHFSAGAKGYSDLLGALRTAGKLPGDLRELMILRIAALNRAAYEWIQHEPIARKEGLTTGQMYAIRDIDTPLPPTKGILSPLLEAGLGFVEALTLVNSPRSPFPLEMGLGFKAELRKHVESGGLESGVEDETNALYAEASMLVATYNLVSRFLLATDVDGLADADVPWPLERVEHDVSLPSYPGDENSTRHNIYAITLRHPEPAPWIVLSNSLLTNTSMWGWIVPYLLDGSFATDPLDPTTRRRYNILLHDQRGHGRSTLPSDVATSLFGPQHGVGYGDQDITRKTTIPLLAWDIQNLLVSDSIRKILDSDTEAAPTIEVTAPITGLSPIHAIIGVSQGGACALAFGAAYSESSPSAPTLIRRTRAVIACDTSARTAPGNREAWKERVGLVLGGPDASDLAYAGKLGLPRLADVTIPRWFPTGSHFTPAQHTFIKKGIEGTDVAGFVEGARSLGGFDLLVGAPALSEGDAAKLDIPGRPALFESSLDRVLLLAGSLDGNGKVGDGLKALSELWQDTVRDEAKRERIAHETIDGAGHLPMVDRPERWCRLVGAWLAKF